MPSRVMIWEFGGASITTRVQTFVSSIVALYPVTSVIARCFFVGFGFISHLNKGIGTGVELLRGPSVCQVWAPFQAYSDDSPLCVELIIGLVRGGRREWAVLGFFLRCAPFGLHLPSLLPAGLVGNSEKQVAWIGLGRASLGPSGLRFDSLLPICGIGAGRGWCGFGCLLRWS